MSRSRNTKSRMSRPRSGIKSDERQIEHQRHRSRVRKKLHQDPEVLPKREGFMEQGDIWNWD